MSHIASAYFQHLYIGFQANFQMILFYKISKLSSFRKEQFDICDDLSSPKKLDLRSQLPLGVRVA